MSRLYHGGPEVHKKPFPPHTQSPNRGKDAGYAIRDKNEKAQRVQRARSNADRKANALRWLRDDKGQRRGKRRPHSHEVSTPHRKVVAFGERYNRDTTGGMR